MADDKDYNEWGDVDLEGLREALQECYGKPKTDKPMAETPAHSAERIADQYQRWCNEHPMGNEQKAKEIAEQSAYLSDFPHDKKSVMYGALEAMEWKDEQIDTIMLTTEGCLRSFFESQGNTQESIDNFIDALKTQINENLNKL